MGGAGGIFCRHAYSPGEQERCQNNWKTKRKSKEKHREFANREQGADSLRTSRKAKKKRCNGAC
jgi:hypothetical protein